MRGNSDFPISPNIHSLNCIEDSPDKILTVNPDMMTKIAVFLFCAFFVNLMRQAFPGMLNNISTAKSYTNRD